jgi:hypothetical protein
VDVRLVGFAALLAQRDLTRPASPFHETSQSLLELVEEDRVAGAEAAVRIPRTTKARLDAGPSRYVR